MSIAMARLVRIGRLGICAVRAREQHFHHNFRTFTMSICKCDLAQSRSEATVTIPNIPKQKRRMVMTPKLSDEEKAKALKPLLSTGWRVIKERDALYKEYLFKNFNQAFGFITRMALRAEREDHHPEIYNLYNKVGVTLTSHDVDGISSRDVDFATFLDDANVVSPV